MTAVVLGAGRGIGREIARQLVAAGREVRAVTRSGGVPDGAQDVRGDVLDRRSTIEAVRGASVIHLAANVPYPNWLDLLPTMVENTVAAAEAVGAKIVYADNLYAYGPVSGAVAEDTPERPAGPKEKLRSELGKRLRAAAVPVATGRSSDYYGPGGTGSLPGELLIKPMAAGKAATWFWPLDVPHTFAYLRDTARAQIALGDDERADGKVWHAPAAETLTVREFVALTGKVLGNARTPVRLPAWGVKVGSLFDRRLRGSGEMDHQRTAPWVVDHSAFEAAFGPWPVTPHEQAIEETARWYRG
ncbi:NAD-dependent epimerase/dehydratase family protein [Saccharothrix texasensis]|uniref:Nucleoside-diphosphate-sugar epimerase n=1 Tax=Saccharothrix texasensis TaxID=103734 RepID=A0A3N1HBX4_9PSEU|nr:NAD-dependent epimerase/dehydratase family protein [Saccharothrix texasensis]ROP40008.1 nucleoside-diphosphate-sugar epimerase [Saccharothrix texasensis]